MRNKYNRN